MMTFDQYYTLLRAMREDDYFPPFLVDKVELQLRGVIQLLESGETDLERIQKALDDMTRAINALEEEFEAHDSQLETVARDSIGESVHYILAWFHIDIDPETAIREREW